MKSRRLAIVLVMLVLLACTGGGITVSAPSFARERERDEAERRWAQRPFEQYQLVLEDFRCIFDIEVHGQKIITAQPREGCSRDARTIDELFMLIHRDGETSTRCITQGCACDDHIAVYSSYDTVLGYPREIEVRITAQPNWQNADYWRYTISHLQPPTCDFPVGRKFIHVLELRPLP
jgi:hypothetical protein